jgi:hypothetical protein
MVFVNFDFWNVSPAQDEASQEVLDTLESVANKMRVDLDARGTLLRKVQKWQALVSDFHRVESESKDPNRLKNRGGGLLALSKEISKLSKTIPDLFGKLRQEIYDWEMANEVEFKVNDERFTTVMEKMFFETNLVRVDLPRDLNFLHMVFRSETYSNVTLANYKMDETCILATVGIATTD